MVPPTERFQILALDGGGVRGIFTAAMLAGLEEDTNVRVVDRFDLIVGTSTGGVIALALGAGMTPRQILDFYVSEKEEIFRRRPGTAVRRLFRAKYRPASLEAALRSILGDRLLGESSVPLVVPSYDLGENRVHLFKTPHHERLRRDYRVPMWQVAMATSAAPTFFPAFELPADHSRLIDGGVWANNPAMVGVTEAVSMFGQPLSTIRVFSLGTTSSIDPRRNWLDDGGLLRWLRGTSIVDVLLEGQSRGAFNMVQHLIGESNIYRVDPPAPKGLAMLDTCSTDELIGKAAHHSRHFTPAFLAAFGGHSPNVYTPMHGRSRQEEVAHADD